MRLPMSIILSTLDTWACRARRWAARKRATFCSGVSLKGGGAAAAAAAAAEAEAAEGAAAGDVRGGAKREAPGTAPLEEAWGVVAVKRVASETLRGVDDDDEGGCCGGAIVANWTGVWSV